jgi:hypothetical protein
MYTSSGYSVYRNWIRIVNQLQDGEPMNIQNQQKFFEANMNKFMGWVLNHVVLIGSNGRDQMSYITFILHYYGLSRDGIDILSKYGYSVTLDMFDKFRMYQTSRSIHTIR